MNELAYSVKKGKYFVKEEDSKYERSVERSDRSERKEREKSENG